MKAYALIDQFGERLILFGGQTPENLADKRQHHMPANSAKNTAILCRNYAEEAGEAISKLDAFVSRN